MKKYDHDNNSYVKNHLENRRRRISWGPIPDFDTYFSKASKYDMAPKKDLLFRYKKKYEKNVRLVTHHNEWVQLSKGRKDAYLELLKQYQTEKRTKKFYFWLGPLTTINEKKK